MSASGRQGKPPTQEETRQFFDLISGLDDDAIARLLRLSQELLAEQDQPEQPLRAMLAKIGKDEEALRQFYDEYLGASAN